MTPVRRAQQGFTIIEILIVLAIVGTIILIVFLAVPAINRQGRNTLRRQDAKMVAAQRTQYNIDIKTTIAAGSFDCSLPHTSKKFCEYIVDGMSYYALDNVTFRNQGLTPPTSVPVIDSAEDILTDTYLKCDAKGVNAVIASGPRAAVVLYAVETRTGIQQQCIESSVLPSM